MTWLTRIAFSLTIGIAAAATLVVTPASAGTVSVTLSSRPAAAGSMIYLTAIVSPNPIGGDVTFTSDQGDLASAPVIFGKAETWFIPEVSGSITVTAIYGSFDGGTTGSSAPLVISVGGGGVGASSVSLDVDATVTVGKPTRLAATVSPSTDSGRVTFSVDGTKVAAVDVAGGRAATTWKPTTAGQHTISVRYSGVALDDAVASRTVTAVPAGGGTGPPADVIVLDPAGNLTPWSTAASVTLANGTRRQLVATAASGASVALAVAGPCSLSGNVLTIDAGSDTCTLTAVSPGGNGFAATAQNYGIVLVPGAQQADLEAPPSGRVARSSSFLLGPAGQTTNLGKPVRWSVSGSSTGTCRVIRASRGSRLEIGPAGGTCRVRARAAGIPGQWRAFVATRVYRAP